ncbi:MAG: carboxypeptidase regulatory-like domain-containing protein [Myxococcales bacterium]|nr:carboxypeptidase regulatory-like domain-containing protein [Myxococcales bacterium]
MTGCHPSPRGPAAPTTGSIGGLVVDHVTGEAVRATLTAHDQQSFVVASAHTAGDGAYRIDGLAPGTYDMVVELPGTSVQLVGIPVTAGHVTAFDIPVDSADVELPPQPYERVASDQILRFTPPDADPRRGVLEGTINDIVTRERVGAAVVTATSPVLTEALTGVSDDAGRFRFDDLPPGTYMLSAFYQVARRGQIEVRRTEIVVDGGTQVVVPLFVELSGTQ